MNANSNKALNQKRKNDMIDKLTEQFEEIFTTMGFSRIDPQTKDSPKRIAKMYVNEIFSGCFSEEPAITTFPNTKEYNQMIFLGPVELKSMCSHHWMPFIGNAYIAYIPGSTVVGISKLARIVKWFMQRPQIQEELTEQIAEYIEEKLGPLGCAVYIEATHLCTTMRGVKESKSVMRTCALRGNFLNPETKTEFLMMVQK